jgi:hypothetical protein
MGGIPAKTHGLIDYITGIALLLAPNIFRFSDVGGAAVDIPRIIGIAVILLALLSNHEYSLAKLISMRAHLTIDYILGIFLAASPFLFGFSNEEANAWLPHIVVGLSIFLLALMTRAEPKSVAAES